jgi:hypothetical protein
MTFWRSSDEVLASGADAILDANCARHAVGSKVPQCFAFSPIIGTRYVYDARTRQRQTSLGRRRIRDHKG